MLSEIIYGMSTAWYCWAAVCCLGTMTWGKQNTEAEAHQQLSYAFDYGLNFLDTAEMYPVPPEPSTQGATDRYIGSWMKNRNRQDIILATKVRFRYYSQGRDWLWVGGRGVVDWARWLLSCNWTLLIAFAALWCAVPACWPKISWGMQHAYRLQASFCTGIGLS